jgi:hypothetical protein
MDRSKIRIEMTDLRNNESEIMVFTGLPKISLNEWYAGKHWSKRVAIKNAYKLIIRSKYKGLITFPSDVEYWFEFKSNPLDCSNCIAMVKMIEDIIFEKDSPKFVRSVKVRSKKGTQDKVNIIITY